MGQLGEGWINIEKLGERHRLAAGFHSGRGDDERRARGDFEVGGFAPQPVISQVPAVIAIKQNDGVLAQSKSIKLGEHAADLGIDVTDARKIAVAQIARVGLGEGIALRLVGVAAHFAGVVPRHRGRALGQLAACGELDFFRVIQIPIFFRRDKGRVRLDETDTEKERFALQFPQRGDGGISGLAVLQCVVRHCGCLGHWAKHELPRPVIGRGVFWAIHPAISSLGLRDASLGIIIARTKPNGRRGPRRRIAHRVPTCFTRTFGQKAVIHFPNRARLVAVIFEILRQRDHVRIACAKVNVIMCHPRGLRPQPRHQARARGIAQRLLAIGPLK